MILNKVVFYYCLFQFCFFHSQNNNIVIKGKVVDSLQQPVPSATLIAVPKQNTEATTYAIADSNGFFKLQVVKEVNYSLSISHIGHHTINQEVNFTESKNDYVITLNQKTEPLDAVIIDYKYEPITKNKDTITYNLKAFTNGNEFKMEDVLEKLPGVKIEDDVVKVQGKTVTKLLVEGKSFFDGSTKLAIENIPADVMDKIEIISDYKESELLRNLADNEDLALNVVLKEDKKDFAFGDIEGGVGLDEFYSLHSAIFKYNPKSNISFIGDINNFNNSSLSFKDLSRLVGGSSNLFKRSSISNNLLNLASNNNDRFESITRFSALNFQHEFNDKLNISGYGIYSNNDIVNKSLSIREYFGDTPILESRNDLRDTDNNSSIFNLKFDYNPNKSQKWLYNFNYLGNNSIYNQESLSDALDTNQFFSNTEGSKDVFSQNLEGYFKINNKHTFGIALNHSLASSNSQNNWSSNNAFLESYLPLTSTTDYQIIQNNDFQAQKFNVLLKDYWISSRYYHLFFSAGINYNDSKIKTDISQLLPDQTIINFSELINDNRISLADINLGLGLKSKFGKFEFTLEAKPHYYSFNRANTLSTNLFIEPKFDIIFKINDDTDLDFDYSYSNRYLSFLNYLENLRLTGFNSITQGNPELEDERFHNFGLYYSNYEKIDKFFIDASIDYSINNPVKNNAVVQEGINQLNTPTILNLPENNLNFNTELGFVFKKSSLEFGIDLDWLKINQLIDNEVNLINSFEYTLRSKFLLKLNKTTQMNVKYVYNGYNVISDEYSESSEQIISFNFDTRFLKNFIFKTDFSTHFVNDFSNTSQNYTNQNLYLGYSKPNSKFSYSLNFRNIYNNGILVRNNFTNNLLVSNQIFTLPRVLLFELKYKF